MAKLTLALDKGGPKRVELEWGFAFKNLRVRVDGVELGTIATKAELEAGRSFVMSDGSSLMVDGSGNSGPLRSGNSGRPRRKDGT